MYYICCQYCNNNRMLTMISLQLVGLYDQLENLMNN